MVYRCRISVLPDATRPESGWNGIRACLERDEIRPKGRFVKQNWNWLMFGIPIGTAMGIVVGVLIGNIALGAVCGAALGVVLGSAVDYAQRLTVTTSHRPRGSVMRGCVLDGLRDATEPHVAGRRHE